MNVMDHIDALDIHARTAKYLASPGGYTKATGGGFVVTRQSGADTVANAAVSALREMVERGDTYFVSPAITDSLIEASRSLPGNWAFHESILPSDAGVCIYPFGQEERRSVTWGPFAGFGWCRVGETGFFLSSFHEAYGSHRLSLGRTLFWRYGVSLDEAADIQQKHKPATNSPFSKADQDLAEKMRMNFYASVFQWMQDRIVVATTKSVPRPAARRAVQSLKHEPVVSVIELRARHYETVEREGEPQHRDYACQWIVRGHWRNQWYPSLGRHQPKWITPYVKGPDDKPLKTPRANVFAVVR